jgi:hypothetical protein
MADFYVPIATNTLSSIDSLIANAKGTEAVGNAIGNLPDAYWAGQEQEYKQRNRNLFQNGVPADMATALIKAQGTAGVPNYIELQRLGIDQDLAKKPLPDFSSVNGAGVAAGASHLNPFGHSAPPEVPRQQGGYDDQYDYERAGGGLP